MSVKILIFSVIVMGIDVLYYCNLSQQNKTFEQLYHAREVIEKIEVVSSTLKDAELEQQGYILTGQKYYLEPYLAILAKTNTNLKSLRKLTAENHNQQIRIESLDSLITEKSNEFYKTVNLRHLEELEATLQGVLTDRNKRIMGKIHAVIHQMKREEIRRLRKLVQEAQANAQKDTLISIISVVLNLILLYLIYDSINRELAARKQAELAQQQLNAAPNDARENEEKLNAIKSRIITVISHEYRTPLTTILSSAELLEHYSHKLSEARKIVHIQRIQSAVNHLTELVAEVVEISEAEAGELEFNPSPLDLESFCRQLVQELQTRAGQEHPIVFVSLGNCASCVMDEKILRQIFTNLLLNAIKYSHKGSTVHFELRPEKDRVVFQVRDEGLGIPAADQSQLFKAFERGSNIGTISGIGLGLAIAKKLVDLQGGQIAVDSVVGIGTTITVTLPLFTLSPHSQQGELHQINAT